MRGAWCAGALGALALLGWAVDAGLLKRLGPGRPEMMPNAALCYLLAAVSIVVNVRAQAGSARRRVSSVCGAVVLAVGLLTLFEYAFGVSLGIDRLLFRFAGSTPGEPPGRLAANAAIGLALLGAAILVWERSVRGWWPSDVLAWFAGWPARADRGALARLAQDGQSGIVLRRMLLAAIGLPLLLAALALTGQRLGLFGSAVSGWLFASILTIVFTGLAWAIAGAGERLETDRRRVESMLQAVSETAPDAIVVADKDGAVTYVNPAVERIFGRSAAELIGRPMSVLISPRDHPRLQRLLDHPVAGSVEPDTGVSELSGLDRRGRELPIEISWSSSAQTRSCDFCASSASSTDKASSWVDHNPSRSAAHRNLAGARLERLLRQR